MYEFEECNPDRAEYRVEYIGSKSQNDSQEYFQFLEDMGYRVFFKNINLNYSIGKVRYRPWAEKGGRIATNNTAFNKELLIVEKEKDGKPFELHTSFEDKIQYYESLRKPYAMYFVVFLLIGVLTKIPLFSETISETTSFSVDVPEKVTVSVLGKEHDGGFTISY